MHLKNLCLKELEFQLAKYCVDTFLLSFAYQSNELDHKQKAKASMHNLNMSPTVHL